MHSRLSETSLAIVALVALVACDKKPPDAPAQKAEAPASAPPATASAPPAAASAQPVAAAAPEAAPQPNAERNAYFGETHIHTSWSVDAWVMGNRLTGPADAYQYAQGQTIKHPMGFDI